MSRTLKIWFAVGLLVLVGGFSVWQFSGGMGDQSTASTHCRIALLVPETGNLAYMGVPIKNAMEMALDVNREALKKDGITIDLLPVDSKGNPKDAVTSINRTLDIDGADAVVSFQSGVTAAVAPIIAKRNVFCAGLTVDPTFLNETNNTAIRVFFSYKRQSELLAQICERRNFSKVLIFHCTDQASTYSMETVLQPLLKASGKIFEQETFNLGQRDFKDIIAKHANYDGNAIIIEGFGGEFPQLVSTIRSTPTLKDLPILGTLGCMGVKADLQAQMAGVEFIAPRFVVKDQEQVYQKLRKTFSERYPTAEFSYTAVYAYDVFDIIAFAVRNSKSLDGNSLFNSLQNATVPAFSDNYQFDAKGDFAPSMALAKFSSIGEIVFQEDIQ